MPFVTQVQCFKSKTVLATFFHNPNRYYLLDGKYQIPLQTKIVWCETCKHFTECEKLYSIDEINATIAELDDRRDEWDAIDAKHRDRYKLTNRELPSNLTQQEIYNSWNHALAWRGHRSRNAHCLTCKSTTGIVELSTENPAKHPAIPTQWIESTVCHASVAASPPIQLFNASGFRIQASEPPPEK